MFKNYIRKWLGVDNSSITKGDVRWIVVETFRNVMRGEVDETDDGYVPLEQKLKEAAASSIEQWAKRELREAAISSVNNFVNSEDFIDKIIDRINRKQVKG